MKKKEISPIVLLFILLVVYIFGIMTGAYIGAKAVIYYQLELVEAVNIETFEIDFNESVLMDNVMKQYKAEQWLKEQGMYRFD